MTSKDRVLEKWPDAQAVWTSRGWRIITSVPCAGNVIGATQQAHVHPSYAWDDAASRIPKRLALANLKGEQPCADCEFGYCMNPAHEAKPAPEPLCTACEGNPQAPNNPCIVCGKSQPAPERRHTERS